MVFNFREDWFKAVLLQAFHEVVSDDTETPVFEAIKSKISVSYPYEESCRIDVKANIFVPRDCFYNHCLNIDTSHLSKLKVTIFAVVRCPLSQKCVLQFDFEYEHRTKVM